MYVHQRTAFDVLSGNRFLGRAQLYIPSARHLIVSKQFGAQPSKEKHQHLEKEKKKEVTDEKLICCYQLLQLTRAAVSYVEIQDAVDFEKENGSDSFEATSFSVHIG